MSCTDNNPTNSSAAAATAADGELHFSDFTLESIPLVAPYLPLFRSNTCDMTLGGIYMWIDYFRYRYCIHNDTLFIIGREEDHRLKPAFSVPLGKMTIADSLPLMHRYALSHGFALTFSAVPEAYLDEFRALNPKTITEIEGWSDYVYCAEAFATFAGKKMNKKRNQLHKFEAQHPEATTEPITDANRGEVMDFYHQLASTVKDEPLARYEYRQVGRMLDNLEHFPFISQVLKADGRVVGFSIAEIVNDTLHAHIEKVDHSYAGATEYLNRALMNHALAIEPRLRFENRQDDAGDAGLRQSKMSYNPIALLAKYDVEF